MTNEELHGNRKCPYGGGINTCPCNGDCPYMKPRYDDNDCPASQRIERNNAQHLLVQEVKLRDMQKTINAHHREHPDYGAMGCFAGYGEHE